MRKWASGQFGWPAVKFYTHTTNKKNTHLYTIFHKITHKTLSHSKLMFRFHDIINIHLDRISRIQIHQNNNINAL